ncbi:claudin-23 [Thalassophryne amazonica]|uniref:claudin-23 n=1 Tax=Thalassophryne amazonica TaxID=390379 RepID=UPI00147255ED|nr:claudin-23 [Thalassophryne amazonica]
MQRRSTQWVRLSMRTPGILIFGMVLAPCGWILDLTATVAPNWRTFNQVVGRPQDVIIQQGIWDICEASSISSSILCNQPDSLYFSNQVIRPAQGLMVASLIVTLCGLAVAIPGVRCWKDTPNWTVAGLGGILIFLSGVMTIIPIAWYTNIINSINTATSGTITVGYCIVLGYIGGILEILGGFVMFIGICRCCGGKNRGERRVREVTDYPGQQKPPSRRVDLPSLDRSRSNASSVPYSKNSLDDDVSFPRAKTPERGSVNTSYNGTPGDVDL